MKLVSVPSFGDSFFMMFNGNGGNPSIAFPSPHSGILFLWKKSKSYRIITGSFRPLIRGFFFYCWQGYRNRWQGITGFRPLIRGFFFYYLNYLCIIKDIISFRPLIRGFFFYAPKTKPIRERRVGVSVPSFGDSFFIQGICKRIGKRRKGSFRPLIRGFFFYPVVMICRQV